MSRGRALTLAEPAHPRPTNCIGVLERPGLPAPSARCSSTGSKRRRTSGRPSKRTAGKHAPGKGAPRLRNTARVFMSSHTQPEPVERVDLRQLPTWERHDRMLAAFDRLTPNQVVEFTNDHEPKALRATIEAERDGIMLWDSRNLGDGRWVIRMTRLPEPVVGGEAPRISFLRRCTMFRTANIETLREVDRM